MSTLRLSGPGELIAAIPALLGYTPHESLVVLSIRPDRVLGPTMRMDREGFQHPAVVAEYVSTVTSALIQDGSQGAVIVCFTDDHLAVGCPAADVLKEHLEHIVDEVDVWACADGRYWGPGCLDVACCPSGGRPLPPAPPWPEPRDQDETSGVVWAPGHDVAAVSATRAPSDERRRAYGAGDRWSRRRQRDPLAWRQQAWRICRDLPVDAWDALEVGRAIASIQDVRVRDALIVSWCGADDDTVRDVLAGVDSPGVEDAMSTLLTGPSQASSEGESADRLLWCAVLSAHARSRDIAAVHTLAAVAWWIAGDLPGAASETHLALDADPSYTLAMLMKDLCSWGASTGALAGRAGSG